MSASDDGDVVTLNFYNSLTRQKEPLVPLEPGKMSMYTCGPTVYDYAHVGNFRAFLTYDVVKRALQYFGYEVDHICNLTDVDDKIIARCDREDVSLEDLTNKFANLFQEDLELLNIVPAREYPRATQHIDEMVQMILDLADNDLAYQSEEGSWYFNVQNKEGYGQQLVNLDVANLKQKASGVAGAQRGAESDADEYDADKVGLQDFALWKAHKPQFDREDATWDTKLGKGRPGWHLECSAMAKKYLGPSIDIHCGGIDLKFPHHENEIAQSEGANQQKFCSCWIHNGFVNIGDEKMSKSKGNFLTLRTACPKPDEIRAYRYLIVSSQYRNPLSFTKEAMGAAKGALTRMDKLRKSMDDVLKDYNPSSNENEDADSGIVETTKQAISNFEVALIDDLSMPRATACLFQVVKAAETEFKRFKKETDDKENDNVTPLDLVGIYAVKEAMDNMDKVFGVFYTVPEAADGSITNESEEDVNVPSEVMALVEERSAAKTAQDWSLADSLRDRIQELGFTVKDVKNGAPEVTRIG